MKKSWRVAGIAAIYIGTVVGAGFASGQEIWEFFTRFGTRGALGLVLSTTVLIYLGTKSILWGMMIKARSYKDFLYKVAGERLGTLGDWTMSVFLFFLTGVMLAGAGAVAVGQGLKWEIGCWGTIILAVFVLSQRLNGIRGVNLVVIPLLFFTALMLQVKEVSIITWRPPAVNGNLWVIAAFQYSGYNLFLSLPVLVTLHQIESDPVVLKWGGVLGGFALGVLAFLFYRAIMGMPRSIVELPLMSLIKSWGRGWGWVYAFVLWGELFSTLVAHVFGLAARLGLVKSRRYLLYLSIIMVLPVLISGFGFARLVRVIYPLFGVISILILIPLGIKPLPSVKIEKKYDRKGRIFTV